MNVQAHALRPAASVRVLGWLAVAAMLVIAVMGPGAQRAFANHAVITHPSGNPTCAELGYSLSFKIDTGDLDETTYEEGDQDVATNWDGQEITISNLSGDGQTFDFSATLPVSAVLVKAGTDNHNLYTYNPPTLSDTGLTHGAGQQGISHLLFCGNEPEVTPPPTPEVTPPPTPEVTPPPTPEVTPPPTPEVTPPPTPEVTPSPVVTPAPTGGVGGATGTPRAATAQPTLPPTDSVDDGAAGLAGSWRLMLAVMAGLLAAILVISPKPAVRRR